MITILTIMNLFLLWHAVKGRKDYGDYFYERNEIIMTVFIVVGITDVVSLITAMLINLSQ